MSIDKLKTKFFNGAFINNVKHYFDKINEIIDYLNGNPIPAGYTPPYKSYIGALRQTGTNAPTVKEMYNDLGTISFNRVAAGIYTATSSGLFTVNKTVAFISSFSDVGDNQVTVVVDPSDDSIITIITSGPAGGDGALFWNSLEIKVYN